ncbi:MAG: ISAs1 family transposase [Rhodobacteraceae bacterium]|nr:ISAs1 family transposase [Paracoccaceae bacterium]
MCSRWTPCIVKKTFRTARKAKSHLLVQVKENQLGLLRKIKQATVANTPLARQETIDQGKRTRHETRTVEVFDAAPLLQKTPWNGLIAHIIGVKRSTLMRRAKDGMWERREEICFYVCSAPISAKKAAEAIRGHWGVENKNHYVRDVAMLEDASRIRANPGIFARARSFALNILRANGETNIADALWRNALNLDRPLAYRFM